MERLKFIHAADLHLGASVAAAAEAPDFIKNQVQNSINRAVENMVQDAIERQVDFIILAGDLFDQENRSIKSQIFLKRKLELLNPYDIPVYIIFGNHDPVHRKYAPAGWSDNVHIFSVEPERKVYYKNGQIAAFLYGCSYQERKVSENLANRYKKVEGAPFHIGILHGQEKQGSTDDSPYAPFSIGDLERKGMDYWALGHIHKRRYLTERIGYPGNIQGRHRKERGVKGYSLVYLEKEGIDIEFVPTSTVVFEQIVLPITGHETFNSLTQHLLQLIENVQSKKMMGLCLEVKLIGEGRLSEFLRNDIDREEWREAINEIGVMENPFFYVYDILNKTNLDNQADTDSRHSFLRDVKEAAEEVTMNVEPLEEEWKPLLEHTAARKFLDLQETDKNQIIEEAQQLIDQLWEKGGSE